MMDLGIMLIRVALQKYQKDAIYRQMLEYKREKATLESQMKDVQKRAVDHDDHLRVIDAWWSQVTPQHLLDFTIRADAMQLLDEVRLLAEDEIPDSDADSQSSSPKLSSTHTNIRSIILYCDQLQR